MGQTVNLLAYAYDGSNPSPSTKRFIASALCSEPGSQREVTLSAQAGVAQW